MMKSQPLERAFVILLGIHAVQNKFGAQVLGREMVEMCLATSHDAEKYERDNVPEKDRPNVGTYMDEVKRFVSLHQEQKTDELIQNGVRLAEEVNAMVKGLMDDDNPESKDLAVAWLKVLEPFEASVRNHKDKNVI